MLKSTFNIQNRTFCPPCLNTQVEAGFYRTINYKKTIKTLLTFLLVTSFVLLSVYSLLSKEQSKDNYKVSAQSSPNDWPMLQHDPQHTGSTSLSVTVSPINGTAKWVWVDENHITHDFLSQKNAYINYPAQRDVILSGDIQPIVAENKVFFGATNGEFYALDGEDASTIWKAQLGGAILHTAAYANGTVVTGCMDGSIYAFNAQNGNQNWIYTTEAGISVAPIIVNNVVYVGSRDGYFYAVNLSDGSLKWRYRNIADSENHPHSQAPIMQSAASDGNYIFFGAENMFFYALDAETGNEVWRKKLEGQSFMYSWPVVDTTNNIVMTYVMVPYGRSEWLLEAEFDALPDIEAGETRLEYAARVWPLERDMLRNWLEANPAYRSFHVMRTSDGVYPFAERVPMGRVGGIGYPARAPVIDNQGRILTYWRTKSATYFTRARFGSYHAPDISAMNPNTGDRVWLEPDTGFGASLDNNGILTVGGNWLYTNNHMMGVDATSLENGNLMWFSKIMAKWDGGSYRSVAKLIWWGNDDDTSTMDVTMPPPSIHRSPQGDCGLVIAEVNGRPIAFIQESGHYQIDFGALAAVENQ